MTQYKIHSTQACWVTWTYEIEAESPEEAEKKFNDGNHDSPIADPEIGDGIPGYDLTIEVEAA